MSDLRNPNMIADDRRWMRGTDRATNSDKGRESGNLSGFVFYRSVMDTGGMKKSVQDVKQGIVARDPSAYPVSPKRHERAVKRVYVVETLETVETKPLPKPLSKPVVAARKLPHIEPVDPAVGDVYFAKVRPLGKLLSPAQRKAAKALAGEKKG